jgi:PKD repeat protein
MKPLRAVVPLLVLLAMVASPVLVGRSAAAGKVEPALWERLAVDGTADFIVRFAEQADLSPAAALGWEARGWFVYDALQETAGRSQAGAIAYLDRRGLAHHTFFAGNDLYVWAGDLAAAQALAGRPEVASVRATRTYFVDIVPGTDAAQPTGDFTWGVLDVQAPAAWAVCGKGAGAVVADIGTGVQWDHPALVDEYKCAANPGDPACWYDPEGTCGGTPCDNVGAGTHAMGIMVGKDDPTLAYMVGVAPEAQWIACKACATNACSDFGLTSCADWAMAPGGDPNNRPHVVNNGWGGGGCDAWFEPYVDNWRAAGILPTFGLGSSGPGCAMLASPGDYATVFAAQAHDSARNVSPFGPRGPSCFTTAAKPNVSAPGMSICSSFPINSWNCDYSGTSRATSFAAGAAAVLLGGNPALRSDPEAVMQCLELHTDTPPDGDCGSAPGGGNYTYGWGYVNVLAAGQACCIALPTASFESDSPVCLGQTMFFTDTSMAVPPIDARSWDFGDGSTSTETNPLHDYAAAGTYTVTLTVTNTAGSDMAANAVTVGVPAVAAFDYAPPRGVVPLTVYFTNTSPAGISPTWAFGDGGVGAGDLVTHTYAVSGTYTATLTVESPGCGPASAAHAVQAPFLAPPVAGFTAEPMAGFVSLTVAFADASQGSPPLTAWQWDFGDGGTSTETNPAHTFTTTGTFPVLLTVANLSGTDAISHNVVAWPWPEAGFAHSNPTGVVPWTVYFTNTSQWAISPTWAFGDGGLGAGDQVSHTFDVVGTFTVVLTVTSPYSGGVMATAVGTVVASAPPCQNADLISVTPAISGCQVTFTPQVSGDPPFTWLWTFGDGVTSTAGAPTHTYTQTGTYGGTAEVWNCADGHDQLAFVVAVECTPPVQHWSVYLPLVFRGYGP